MASPDHWKPRLLYAFVIGNRDRDQRLLETQEIKSALRKLYRELIDSFGGMTRIKFLKAIGETQQWGKEPSTMVLILTEMPHEETADALVATKGAGLTRDLAQHEVWITKQSLHLHIARHGGEQDQASKHTCA